MDEPLRITRRFVVPAADLREKFTHSSGPGGQGVNTSDSRVELTFDVARAHCVPDDLRDRLLTRLARRLVDGQLTIVVSDERRQWANRRLARARLTAILVEAAAPPPRRRRATEPTRASKERRLAGKRRRADVKRHRGRPDV